MAEHSHFQVPPDSTGKMIHTHSNDISGDIVHNQVVTLGDPHDPEQLQYIDNQGAAYMRFAEGSPMFDAFGKTKVSQEHILSHYISEYDELPEYFQHKSLGAASYSYHMLSSSVTLGVTDADGDCIKRTSNKYHNYIAGFSQYIEMTTLCGDSGKDGNVRKWGYFDDNDGLYFELNGTTFNVVLRSSVSGSVVETRIPQSSFNVDMIDGSGGDDNLSRFDIDLTKLNIFWIDFQWLGAGAVRFGVMSDDGYRITCHKFKNANHNNSVYMRTGSLPVRWQNINEAATASSSELRCFSSTVFTEGQVKQHHTDAFSAIPPMAKTVDNTQFTPIWSLRLPLTFKGKENRNAVIPHMIDLNVAGDDVVFMIVKNATLTGDTWNYTDIDPSSCIEGDVEATDFSGGKIVYSTTAKESDSKEVLLKSHFSYYNEYLKLYADGESSETYTLVAKSLGTSSDIFAVMTWHELR